MTGPALLVAPSAMLLALGLDRCFGEPPAFVHPVVLIGRVLGAIGARIVNYRPTVGFAVGALAWTGLCAFLAAATWGVERSLSALLSGLPPWSAAIAASVIDGLLLKPLFAWRMLRDEVREVESALARGLPAGRSQVGRIAGRSTAQLNAVEVRETAIESLAENVNDSVIAPLFWYAIAGLPGAVIYRFANTADAMWGRRGEWEWAGKWAARADDLFSFVPARLTGLALLPPSRWHLLRKEARRTVSPNGGWPMGAMALRLGIRLGRPGFYVLNAAGRGPSRDDTERAIRLAGSTLFMLIPLLMIVASTLAGAS